VLAVEVEGRPGDLLTAQSKPHPDTPPLQGRHELGKGARLTTRFLQEFL